MQIRIKPIRDRSKAIQMSAVSVASDAQWMLHQLALPVAATDTIKARRVRAISRAGISPAKGFRLWYGYATALLAHEFIAICEAYKSHVRTQERLLADELEQLRALRATREEKERQYALDLARSTRAVGQVSPETQV